LAVSDGPVLESTVGVISCPPGWGIVRKRSVTRTIVGVLTKFLLISIYSRLRVIVSSSLLQRSKRGAPENYLSIFQGFPPLNRGQLEKAREHIAGGTL
jgi:hypothetical protein